MNKELLYSYRPDYIAYILGIIGLDIVALHYQQSYFFLLPLGIVWLQMLWQALKNLQKKRISTELFLVFATLAALMGQQIHAIMLVLLIMVIAHYIELLIEQRTKNALESLIHLIPSSATILSSDGQEKVIPLDQVVPGMHSIVKTGSLVPADGFIISGQATLNEASLTGESIPKEKHAHDLVFAGTFIEAGSIVFQVQHVQKETLFGKMTTLLSQAEHKKAHITVITEKITIFLVPLILILIFLAWLITGNLTLVITLLIFGSPLELSLVTPLTVLAGSVAAFRHGILVRGGRALEHFAHVDTIVFDKTGTLTLGEPTVVNIQSFDTRYSTLEILKIAAIAELRSDHVIAKSILKKAHELNLKIPQPDEYISLVGHGIEIMHENTRYFLGNQHFIQAPEHGNSTLPPEYVATNQAYSIFYLACNGKVIGIVNVMDTVRADARTTIKHLQQLGISTIILISGDRQEIADTIAQQLGIKKAYGQAFPEQKLLLLDELQKQGKIVAMIGDGINDVAALKQAHVGIAMGAMGMAPAIEAADIVLMTNELTNIVFVRRLSQKVFKVIQQNLILGFMILHILGLVLTLMGLINPIQAAFFHALSDIVILLNASRLIKFK